MLDISNSTFTILVLLLTTVFLQHLPIRFLFGSHFVHLGLMTFKLKFPAHPNELNQLQCYSEYFSIVFHDCPKENLGLVRHK
jgi:hypothetical protein